MKTICLNMIVKNESSIIERCLLSIKPLIDYWVIADTGSSDGTQEKILSYLKDVPGELLERPWVDFSHNRNEVLQASQGKGDYLLFIDADEWLLPSPPLDIFALQKDCYLITARGKTSEFLKIFLINNHLNWTWHGVLHESLSSTQPTSKETLPAILIYDENSGSRAQNPQKYLEDAKILEKALLKDPHHPRYTFYLAQCYTHAQQFPQALFYYEQRISLGGDSEELFWSLYCIACLKKDLNYPSHEIIKAFSKAYQYKPTQAEPLYRLATHLEDRPFLAYLLTKYAKNIPLPQNAARLQNWIYEDLPQKFTEYESRLELRPKPH